jgi:protein-disulfide isomerase
MRLVQGIGGEDHFRGRADAAIVLIAYGDYECPLCARANRAMTELFAEAADDVCFVVRHFSLSLIHPRAMLAAQAAEAAGAQGRFWAMHEKLLENQDALMVCHLAEYARLLGLDVARFSRDLRSGVHLDKIERDFRSGLASGVNATPTYFLDGKRVDGAWSEGKLLRLVRERQGRRQASAGAHVQSARTMPRSSIEG